MPDRPWILYARLPTDSQWERSGEFKSRKELDLQALTLGFRGYQTKAEYLGKAPTTQDSRRSRS